MLFCRWSLWGNFFVHMSKYFYSVSSIYRTSASCYFYSHLRHKLKWENTLLSSPNLVFPKCAWTLISLSRSQLVFLVFEHLTWRKDVQLPSVSLSLYLHIFVFLSFPLINFLLVFFPPAFLLCFLSLHVDSFPSYVCLCSVSPDVHSSLVTLTNTVQSHNFLLSRRL